MSESLFPEHEWDFVDIAVERVKTAWRFHSHMNPDGKPMEMCFSGGKDSTALFFVCKRASEELGIPMGDMFKVKYNVTNIDPPEVVQFVRKMKESYPFIEFIHPKKTFWQLIVENRMPPTRQRRYCCKLIKESTNLKGGYTFTGVRRAESTARSARRGFETSEVLKKDRILFNDNGDDRRETEYCMQQNAYICNPIIDWTEENVWNFIRSNGYPYCKLYDEGWQRVGCIGCPLSGDELRRKQFERWPGYKRQFIRTFDKMVCAIHRNIENGRPWTGPFEVFTDGQDAFDWWMHDPSFKERRNYVPGMDGSLFDEEADT